jgi:flagellar hook assembly protein FlgD
MFRVLTTSPSSGRRPLLTAAGALIAAATVTTSLLGVGPANAASGASGRVVSADPVTHFSPNDDRVKDKARIGYTLAKKSKVTVKVRRTNGAEKVVLRRELGKVSRGPHTWKWNGKNDNRHVVRDGQYRVVFVADQVARKGKTRRDSTDVFVDTVYEPPGLTTNSATVYPRTPGVTDQIGFRHGVLGSTEEDLAVRVELRVLDAADNVVYTRAEPYRPGFDYPLVWDGRGSDGAVLPAGRYRAELAAVDLAGNAGTAGWAFVSVSDVPLVEATGTMTVSPTASNAAPPAGARVTDGRAATTGGDDVVPVPCGTVVPSTVYADPGAMSYRSSDACGGTYARPSIATATGSVDLRAVTAPRGISSVQVAMRGKPTVEGEADTAELRVGLFGAESATPVRSAPGAGESVTSSSFVGPGWVPTRERLWPGATWSITTHAVDSYDVAAVTVTYKYLTPQR